MSFPPVHQTSRNSFSFDRDGPTLDTKHGPSPVLPVVMPVVVLPVLPASSRVAATLARIAGGLRAAMFWPPSGVSLRPSNAVLSGHEDACEAEPKEVRVWIGTDRKTDVTPRSEKPSLFPDFFPEVLAKVVVSFLSTQDIVESSRGATPELIGQLAGFRLADAPGGMLRVHLNLRVADLPHTQRAAIVQHSQALVGSTLARHDAVHLARAAINAPDLADHDARRMRLAERVRAASVRVNQRFVDQPRFLQDAPFASGLLNWIGEIVSTCTDLSQASAINAAAHVVPVFIHGVNVRFARFIDTRSDHFQCRLWLLNFSGALSCAALAASIVASLEGLEDKTSGARTGAAVGLTLNLFALAGSAVDLVGWSKRLMAARDLSAAFAACRQYARSRLEATALRGTVKDGLRYAVIMNAQGLLDVVVTVAEPPGARLPLPHVFVRPSITDPSPLTS